MHEGGGAHASKKLLAALAVLAVALVALTAVSAVAVESDAGDASPGGDSGTADVTTLAELQAAMENKGINTINIKNSITVGSGETWESPVIERDLTIDGGENKITGLRSALILSNYYASNNVVIKNLELSGSMISGHGIDDGMTGCGAFVDWFYGGKLEFENCEVTSATIVESDAMGEGYDMAGGFIGVYAAETGGFKGCTVKDSTVKAAGLVGGFAGLCTDTDVKFEECEVKGNTLESYGTSQNEISENPDEDKSYMIPSAYWIGSTNGWWAGSIAGAVFHAQAEVKGVSISDESQEMKGEAGRHIIGVVTENSNNPTPTVVKLSGTYNGDIGLRPFDRMEYNKTDGITQALNDNSKVVFLKDTVYTGTIDHVDKTGKASAAKFDKIKFSAETELCTGSIEWGQAEINANASNGKIELTGDVVFVENVTINSGVTLTVAPGAKAAVGEGATLTVAPGAKVVVSAGAEFQNNGEVTIQTSDDAKGSFVAETGATVTGKEIEDITIKTDGEMNPVEISGRIDGSTFGATNEVTVVKDTEILSKNLTIAGRLIVPEGVTLTIDANSKLILTGTAVAEIRGTLVMAEEYGKTPAKIEMSDYSKVLVYGTLDANGDVEIGSASVFSIEEGADAVISGTVTGNVTVKDSASLTVAGAIGVVGAPGSFDVAGTLVISSEKVSQGFSVDLSDGAVVDMEYVIMADGQKIAVEDDGVVIYDSKNKEVKYTSRLPGVYENGSSESLKSFENTLTVEPTVAVTGTMPTGAAGGAAISGIKVTTTETSAKITKDSKIGGTDTKFPATGYYSADGTENLYQHYFTMAVSGSMNVAGKVVYDGSDDLPTVTAAAAITFDAASKGTISEDSAVGIDATFTVKGYVSVDALITLAYAVDGTVSHYGKMVNEAVMTVTGKIDATAVPTNDLFANSGKLVLSGAGEVLINNGSTSSAPMTDKVDGAAYSTSVKSTTGTVCTFHYVTVDAALAAMNAGTTKAVSLYGSNTLAASASVPADAAVTLQSGSALNVGSSSKGKDVVLTFVSGARLAKASSGEAAVTVNGTLYAEKQTDISSAIRGAIKSDVIANETDAKGNPLSSGWAKWTNLTTALDQAEAGQIITINPEAGTSGIVYLKSETTIKEGVVLIVNGKTLTVNNGVSLIVDGTLDLSVAGSGLVVALNYKDAADRSKDKAAANIVLNGTVKAALGEAPVYKGFYNGSKVAQVTVGNLSEANASYGVTTDYTHPEYTIAGAYYSDDDYSYIATVENAAAIISAVKDQEIAVKADESFTGTLKVGDITVAGDATKSDFAVIEIDESVPAIEFGVITLSDAAVTIGNGGTGIKVSATISGADGTVQFKGEAGIATIGIMPYGDDEVPVLFVAAKLMDYRNESPEVAVSTFFKTEGTVYILGGSEIKVDEIVIGGEAHVVPYTSGTTTHSEVVLGCTTEDSVTAGGITTNFATEVVIEGVLNITDAATVTSKKSASGSGTSNPVTVNVAGSIVLKDLGSSFAVNVLTVSGTVDASEISETTLKYTTSVTADVLYIGTDSRIESASDVTDTVFTASAVVKGNVTVTDSSGYAVVAAGAAAPVAWTADDAAFDGTIEMKSTALTTEATVGADAYVTLFATGTPAKHIADFFLATQDSEFEGWMNAKGKIAVKEVVSGDDTGVEAKIGDEGWTTVTAKIDTQIYAVKIVTDGGIASVTLNGILITPGSNGLFVAEKLKAGTYTVAFSAASGYDVKDVRMSAADGTAVSGFSFSVSGMDKDSYAAVVSGGEKYYISSYQLTGSAIAAPSGGSSSGGMSHDDAQGIIDAIDKNTDAVKNQPTGAAADNSLTNILLIVLVVLIVIMAALVAMRMMRN